MSYQERARKTGGSISGLGLAGMLLWAVTAAAATAAIGIWALLLCVGVTVLGVLLWAVGWVPRKVHRMEGFGCMECGLPMPSPTGREFKVWGSRHRRWPRQPGGPLCPQHRDD
jgi:hypothetical protein